MKGDLTTLPAVEAAGAEVGEVRPFTMDRHVTREHDVELVRVATLHDQRRADRVLLDREHRGQRLVPGKVDAFTLGPDRAAQLCAGGGPGAHRARRLLLPAVGRIRS